MTSNFFTARTWWRSQNEGSEIAQKYQDNISQQYMKFAHADCSRATIEIELYYYETKFKFNAPIETAPSTVTLFYVLTWQLV